MQQTGKRHLLFLRYDFINRYPEEIHGIQKRNDGKEHRQSAPAANAEERKKQRGNQHDAYMAPAVKGMQQAHRLFFVIGGAAFHNRADQYLKQTAAYCVQWLLENRPGWKFLLDVCWAEYARTNVLDYFGQLGDRIHSVHFKDYTGGMTCQHMPLFCACGKGIVQLESYMEKVKQMGIEDVIVEQDNAISYPDPMDQMAQSAAYLKRIG